MEEVFLQVVERFTERIHRRQRAMYLSEGPFIDKWRKAMNYIDEDLEAGYPKVWFELEAMAWNHPEMRQRLAKVHRAWRELLSEAIGLAMKGYGIDTRRYPVSALTALVQTFNLGILFERLIGVRDGHDSLLRTIDRLLQAFEKG